MPEFTLTAVIIGILMAVVFGAANAYIGLRVGMTISASIPAAVISMGIIRGIMKRDSILENNMVQTIGSAGESLAAGAIFTLPALFIWSNGELIGAVASGLVIGLVLLLLNKAWGFGSQELPAPQATLMKLVIEGVMNGNLPWALVFMGVGIGIVVELLGIQILPFAVGLYLPIHLSTPIMLGGIIRGVLEKSNEDEKIIKEKVDSGILFSSGLIAGEGLIGILLAVLAIIPAGVDLTVADRIGFGNNILGQWGSLAFFAGLAYLLIKKSFFAKIEK